MNSRKTISPAILLTSLLAVCAPLQAAVVTIEGFEDINKNGGEGNFYSAVNASGSNRRILPNPNNLTPPNPSTSEHSMVEFFEGSASQKMVVNHDLSGLQAAPTFPSGPAEWFMRHLSGGGTIANNTPIPNTGNTWVGYWIKTTSQNLETGIILDDNLPSGNAHEIAVFQSVLGDGMWHLYQFQLSNADAWENFAPGTNNPGGEINNATVTIDSLAFRGVTGVADSVVFYVDSVVYSDSGPIPVPEPSALAFAGLGALAFYRRKR